MEFTTFVIVLTTVVGLWIASRFLDSREAKDNLADLESAIADVQAHGHAAIFRKNFDPQINIDAAEEYLQQARAYLADGDYRDCTRAAEAGLKYIDAIWAAVNQD